MTEPVKGATVFCAVCAACALFASFTRYAPGKMESEAVPADSADTIADGATLVRVTGRVAAFGTGERPAAGIVLADGSAVYGILPVETGELLLGQQGRLIDFEGELVPAGRNSEASAGAAGVAVEASGERLAPSRASSPAAQFPDGMCIVRSWRLVE